MVKSLSAFWIDEKGQALTEYSLILSLVALFLVSSLIGFRDKLTGLLETILATLP